MNILANPRTIFSVDLRAIALFRINLALILIYDLVSRLGDIRAFYTDTGVLPRDIFIDKFANSYHFSVHMAGGKVGYQVFLFAIHLCAALCLLTGFRTRIAAIVSWFLLISLHSRNPIILNGGDVLFRMSLFWAMWLPLGARYSIDAALNTNPRPTENRWLGSAGIAIIVQLSCLYFITAVLKDGKEWWPEGTSSYYALALDQFTTPFGQFLSQWYGFLQFGTYATFALEFAAALLLICPLFFWQVRLFTIASLAFMHFQFDMTMRIGLFPWVDISLLLALLPTAFMDKVSQWIFTEDRRNTSIFYDGECGFCKRIALILRTMLLLPDAQVIPCQEDDRARKILSDEVSWSLRDSAGNYHTQWSGLVRLAEISPLLGPLARILPLRDFKTVGDKLYRFIANRRQKFGPLAAKIFPYRAMSNPAPTLVANLFVAFFIGYVILWNVKTVEKWGISIDKNWRTIAYALRLDQKWNMFAPYPLKNDGYFVVDGSLRSGQKVDAYGYVDKEVDWKKPDVTSWQHKNARWRKYMMNIWQKKKKGHRLYWGKYVCRSWNDHRSYSKKLHRFNLNFIREKTKPPGHPPDLKKFTVWRHNCFKKA